MRTRTIYQALDCVRESSAFFATEKRVRQAGTFERELLRRMDHYDWYEARQRYFDECYTLGLRSERTQQTAELARQQMNAAYMRFAAHPREQAKTAAWRKENGI